MRLAAVENLQAAQLSCGSQEPASVGGERAKGNKDFWGFVLGRRSLETLTRKCSGMAGSWLQGIPSLINDKRLVPI